MNEIMPPPSRPAPPRGSQPRVAIIHYWLVGMRGGERVLERMLRLYPQADVFTHVYDPARVSDTIRAHRVTTTFINALPGARRHYQKYLPLMPMALEEINLSGYDLVISSEAGPAKGVITSPDAAHVCYCHSPMRYLWDHYHPYKDTAGRLARWMMPMMFHNLRQWDIASAQRPDEVIANSHFIARRIRKSWGRDARVIHPPVDVDQFTLSSDIGDHYLWVGQMTPYKRADLVVEAFNRLGLPLLMVGRGELSAKVKAIAGPNITIIDQLDFKGLCQAYARCKALIFPAEEDFGMVPVEANASGRPVLAYGRGGSRDSLAPERSGLFFDEQSVESLIEGVQQMARWLPHFDPAEARANAERFRPEVFDAKLTRVVDDALGRVRPHVEPMLAATGQPYQRSFLLPEALPC